jgi:hypothetical protein
MSATLSTPIKQTYGIWRYDWTGTGPFRVFSYETYQYVLDDTEETTLFVTDGNDIEPPVIEVFDSTQEDSLAEAEEYQPRIVIQWRGYQYADYYTIQKETSPGTYTDVDSYVEDGRGYYKYQGSIEASDYAEYSYRVVVTDKAGYTSSTDFTRYIVRHPDPPELTYTYNAGTGLLTVAAA